MFIIHETQTGEGHITRMEDIRYACKIVVGKPEEKRTHKDLEFGESILLKLILGRQYPGTWIGLMWLRMRTGSGIL